MPKRKPLSSSELAKRKIILPHFNNLGIVREAAVEVGKSKDGLTDDALVDALHTRGVIPGEDPRRGRNIFEACLYLGLVDRRVDSELRYTLNRTGKNLVALRGKEGKLGEEEIQFFIDRALRLKVPNSVHYQDTLLIREKVKTGFKHYYLTKRVRPFALFLKIASGLGRKITREQFISSATTPLLAENEERDSINSAAAVVKSISKKHGFPEGMSPFRDAQVLTSWSEQLGIYKREGSRFQLSPRGRKVMETISGQVPVWWFDFVETHHASLLLSIMKLSDERKTISVKVLGEAVESVIGKRTDIDKDLGELERFGVQVKNAEVSLAKQPLFELDYDVPIQAHNLVSAQSNAISEFVSRRIVVPVEVPVVTAPTPEVHVAPIISIGKEFSDLPILAWRTKEAIAKYGEENVANAFEDLVVKAFRHLGFEITQLGHMRAGRAVPDSAIVDRSVVVAQRQLPYAVLVDCKSTGSPYKLAKSDERAINEYIQDSFQDLLSRMNLLKFFMIVGPEFTNEFAEKASEIEAARPLGISVVGMEADALLRLLELHDSAQYVMSKSFLRLDQILDSAVRQKTGVVNKHLVETLFADAKRKR